MNKNQWQTHITACQKSGQTKTAYADQHKLVYHQFLYWCQKLNSKPTPVDFIEVRVQPDKKTTDCLGVLEFPNGARLLIQSPDLLAWLPNLLSRSC